MTCDGQPMNKSVFHPPRQVLYKFPDPGGKKGLICLGGKPERTIWNQRHATAGAFSHYAAIGGKTAKNVLCFDQPFSSGD